MKIKLESKKEWQVAEWDRAVAYKVSESVKSRVRRSEERRVGKECRP